MLTTSLHEARIDAVVDALLDVEARSVLDLGCGAGALLQRLAEHARFERIVGVDASLGALLDAERVLRRADLHSGRVTLLHGSFTEPDRNLTGFDAAVLLETIEHVDPRLLSRVERTVFAIYRPRSVFLTTPNGEFNALFDMGERPYRDPDHRFEWCRAKFEGWAKGVAARNGYRVSFGAVGRAHPEFGAPTQMAEFRRA